MVEYLLKQQVGEHPIQEEVGWGLGRHGRTSVQSRSPTLGGHNRMACVSDYAFGGEPGSRKDRGCEDGFLQGLLWGDAEHSSLRCSLLVRSPCEQWVP